MAKKARPASPRPASGGGGDSNTGLIVTLVFFVLATLTLGVFTYFGYDGQIKLAENEKKAKAEAAKASKERDEERTRRLVYAIAAGADQTGDQQALNQLKAGNKAAFDAAVGSLKEVKWDAALDRPPETLIDLFGKLRKDADTARAAQRTAETNFAEAQKAFDTDRKALNDQLAKARDDLRDAQNKAVADLQAEKKSYLDRVTAFDRDVSQELANQRAGRADDQAAAEREQRRLSEAIRGKDRQIAERDAKIAPPNSLEADVPKGQILRVDRDSGMVYLNLGSADFLRPQVTFSVLPPNTSGRTAANRDPKATVEVVQVLEPHLSMARIVSASNAMRDPILAGDLVFNPSWNPSQREHVALVGIFDLDGDGRDDTAEVVRNLERQGIVVDAWLDLRERKIKPEGGPGITERTTYLILGDRPQIPAAVAAQAGTQGDNTIFDAFTKVSAKIAEVEKIAKEKGVQPVAARRYLALVGYPLPKLSRQVDASSLNYVRPGSSSSVPQAEPKKDEPK